MPRTVLRVEMPYAAVTEIVKVRMTINNDPAPQDNSNVPVYGQ